MTEQTTTVEKETDLYKFVKKCQVALFAKNEEGRDFFLL